MREQRVARCQARRARGCHVSRSQAGEPLPERDAPARRTFAHAAALAGRWWWTARILWTMNGHRPTTPSRRLCAMRCKRHVPSACRAALASCRRAEAEAALATEQAERGPARAVGGCYAGSTRACARGALATRWFPALVQTQCRPSWADASRAHAHKHQARPSCSSQ